MKPGFCFLCEFVISTLNRFSSSLFWIYLAIVVLAPLPFGGVHALSQALFATVFLFLAFLWGTRQAFCLTWQGASLRNILPETVCFSLVLGWIALQWLVDVPGIGSHPIWQEAQEALGKAVGGGALTPARERAFETFLRLITYAAVFWLALTFGQDRHRARQLFLAIAVSGTVYAVYGLIIHFGGFEHVLWVEHAGTKRDLTATFINRNSYATLAGLGLLCAVGLYQTSLQRGLESRRTGRDRVAYLLQHAFTKGAAWLTIILVLLTALFLTRSRAGVTAGLVAVLCLLSLSRVTRSQKGWMSSALRLCLPVGLIAVYLLSGEGWQHRLLGTDLEKDGRLVMYQQVWQVVQSAPWGGFGAGSFAQVFPLFADEVTSHWEKAHNDWLETLFDLGWPAALLWFAVLFWLCCRCLAGAFRRRRDRIYPMVGGCACVLVGLHALADFSLQIPAVAITFAVLLGVGVGQSWSTKNSSFSPTTGSIAKSR